MRIKLKLSLPGDMALVPRSRQALQCWLSAYCTDETEIGDVVLAFDEAAANVVRHAFPPERRGDLKVVAELDHDHVQLAVEDDGVGFHPDDVPTHADPLAVSGRGLAIIRAVMHDVEVESPKSGGGTRVLMRRKLESSNGSAAAF
jgi:serine/threonine-protein kinase RsbW